MHSDVARSGHQERTWCDCADRLWRPAGVSMAPSGSVNCGGCSVNRLPQTSGGTSLLRSDGGLRAAAGRLAETAVPAAAVAPVPSGGRECLPSCAPCSLQGKAPIQLFHALIVRLTLAGAGPRWWRWIGWFQPRTDHRAAVNTTWGQMR